MRNRKYIEIEGMGRTVFVGATLNRKALRALENLDVYTRTGREVTLDTDFTVQGTEREWDEEAGRRISKILGDGIQKEDIEVVRL